MTLLVCGILFLPPSSVYTEHRLVSENQHPISHQRAKTLVDVLRVHYPIFYTEIFSFFLRLKHHGKWAGVWYVILSLLKQFSNYGSNEKEHTQSFPFWDDIVVMCCITDIFFNFGLMSCSPFFNFLSWNFETWE